MRQEFSKKTMLEAWHRCGGKCECYKLKKPTCDRAKIIGTPEYHHLVPAALGGSNSLENCAVLSPKCHKLETSEETVPEVAKSVRIFEKRAGLRRTKRPFPKHKDPWGKERRQ